MAPGPVASPITGQSRMPMPVSMHGPPGPGGMMPMRMPHNLAQHMQYSPGSGPPLNDGMFLPQMPYSGPTGSPGMVPMTRPGMPPGATSPNMPPGAFPMQDGPFPEHPMMIPPISAPGGQVYPANTPMIFNNNNPNAPPIYPCGSCHKEVRENDEGIMCESGCNFWFHRQCTGLTSNAYQMLRNEPFAEWVCDNCIRDKNIPLIKLKP